MKDPFIAYILIIGAVIAILFLTLEAIDVKQFHDHIRDYLRTGDEKYLMW